MSEVEIVARVERRRQWTAEQKAALMAEVAAADGRVVEVARRHQISPSLLYNQRSALKIAATTSEAAACLKFEPLGVLEEVLVQTAGSDIVQAIWQLRGGVMGRLLGLGALFSGRHFDREIIILCVRWYLRFRIRTQLGPPDEACCKDDGGAVVPGELVVAGGDAAPIFDV